MIAQSFGTQAPCWRVFASAFADSFVQSRQCISLFIKNALALFAVARNINICIPWRLSVSLVTFLTEKWIQA